MLDENGRTIVDLVHNPILLSGLRPEHDIRIALSGIRPGEKLFEEINVEDEGPLPTERCDAGV